MLRSRETKQLFNPGVLPGETGSFQSATKARSELFQLFNNVRAIGVEGWQPALEIIHACSATSFAILKRPKMTDLQLHREKERFHFFVGSPDIAQTAGPCHTIEYSGIWYESDAIAR